MRKQKPQVWIISTLTGKLGIEKYFNAWKSPLYFLQQYVWFLMGEMNYITYWGSTKSYSSLVCITYRHTYLHTSLWSNRIKCVTQTSGFFVVVGLFIFQFNAKFKNLEGFENIGKLGYGANRMEQYVWKAYFLWKQ